jgi:hypothetical protein
MENRRQSKLLSPPPAERMILLLDQFERGDLEAWWKLWPWLEAEDNGRYCEKHHSMDIRELVGWKKATETTKVRLLAAAELYVRGRSSSPEEWFSRRNIKYYPAVAGFRALLLLANEAPSQFEKLPDEVWRRWIPAILRQHHYNELKGHRLLTAMAFQRTSREATEWTLKVIDEENEEGDNFWFLSKLPEQWSGELGSALLERARRGGLKPQCINQLITALIEHRVAGALSLARSHIPKRPPTKKPRRSVSLFAARLLMQHGEPSDWSGIWVLLTADPAFGRELFEGFAHDYAHGPAPVLKTMQAEDVGVLWEWMLTQYPATENRDRRGGGEVTTRDAIADFRDHLISYLADIGTEAGCIELHRLVVKYPQFHWFRRVLGRGQEQMRRNTWAPPAPNQLFGLAENRRARLVQSGSQLLEAITDSLAALQEKLRGERQMAQFLWDGDKPKREEAISEWVAAHLESDLKQRGVMVGREVQIHIYDKTDIHVTAVTRSKRSEALDQTKVIIEVKGCWHREVKTAMKDQLLDRYLADNDGRHGLYVVGWFSLDSWSESDKRRKQVRFPNRESLEACMAKQAQALSNNGHLIQASVMDFSVRTPAPKARPSRIVPKRRQRKLSAPRKRRT